MLEGVNLKILALINAERNRNNNNFDSPDSYIWFAGLILMIIFFLAFTSNLITFTIFLGLSKWEN